MVRAIVVDDRHGPLPGLLLLMTAVTGVVDAVSIISLGRVFVANMTGNIVFIGFALARTPGFSLAASLSALAGFLVGANLGGRVAAAFGQNRARLLAVGAAIEATGVAVALILVAVGPSHLSSGVRDATAAILGVSLGVQNAVVRSLGVAELTTTVLTMTLTGLAADVRAGFGTSAQRRSLAVLVMLGGAAGGALLDREVSTAAALGVIVGVLAVVAGIAVAMARRPAEWHRPVH